MVLCAEPARVHTWILCASAMVWEVQLRAPRDTQGPVLGAGDPLFIFVKKKI